MTSPRATLVLSVLAFAVGTLFLVYSASLAHAAHVLARTGGLQ